MAAQDRQSGVVADIAFGASTVTVAAPTAAQVNALTRIESGLIDGPNTPRSGSTIDLSALSDKESRQKAGPTENGAISATLYREDDGTDAYYVAFDDAVAGNQYLVVSRFGFAGATAAAGDVVDVYTVQMMKREPMAPTRTEAQRFQVELAVIQVDLDSVVVV